MLVLQDVVAFFCEERPHYHFDLKAAGLTCPDGALAADVGVCIRLIRADNDDSGAAVVERLDAPEHPAAAIAVQAELAITTPLSEGAVEFTGHLFEYHPADNTTTS